MIKAIIFDCFGVIITDALHEVSSELAARDPEAYKKVVDIIHANNRGLITPAESTPQIAKILGITPEAFRQRISQGEVKDNQMMTFIRGLRKNYKTGLLSNIGKDSLRRRFSEEELAEHFDAVVVSGEVGYMKPDRAIYRYAAEELGVKPNECIFIDDREVHCRGAAEAGMQPILYEDLGQLKSQLNAYLK